MLGSFISEPLGKHDRSAFTCGVEELDRYFRQQATQDKRRSVAVPYVLVDSDTDAIAGFYTLSSYSVYQADLPESFTRKLPCYEMQPAILIGRLAVDLRYRGQGLGRRLLANALIRCLALSIEVGTVAVIAHAKDDSACVFYERMGFLRFPKQPRRLFIPIASIKQAIGYSK